MNFQRAIKILNKILKEKQPKTFSSSWIFKEAPMVYRYVWKHTRTENDDIDWDRLTFYISRKFQKRWTRYKKRCVKSYEDQSEIEKILLKYTNKLYVLMIPTNVKEKLLQNRIIVALVRISQKGNILASQEIIKWVTFIIEDWFEQHWQVRKWKGYTDDIEDKILACVRCYRYTGTFLGYLFKTLEYSGRGIRPIQGYSLDDPVLGGSKTKIDFVIQEEESDTRL